MSEPFPDRHAPFQGSRSISTRASVLLGLLVIEYWVFKQRFDTFSLVENPVWWAPLIRSLRFNTSWGVCAVLSMLVLGRTRILAAWNSLAADLPLARFRWTYLAAHVLALAAFYLLTERLLAAGLPYGILSTFLPIPWLVAGVLTVAFLGGVLAPIPTLARISFRLRWVVVGGLVLGSVVFAVGAYLYQEWPLSDSMARGTLWLADRFLAPIFPERIYLPQELILGTEAFPVFISRLCSGYEGVSLFLIFFSVFLVLWRDRLRFPHALLLLPLGALAAWILNAVRIAALVVIGTLVSPDVALEGFHVYAGWPLVCIVALGSVALGTRLQFFSSAPVVRPSGINPSAVYLGPLLAWIGAALVAGAFGLPPSVAYAARLIPVLVILWVQRREHAHLRPEWSWIAVGLGGVAFVAWAALVHAFPPDPGGAPVSPEDEAWIPSVPGWGMSLWWAARIAGTCVVVPVVEELAFRGYLARRLIASDFESVAPRDLNWFSLALSSLVFGLLHQSWPAGAAAGMIYAYAYRRRGRLFDAVLAHGVTNALVLVGATVFGDRLLLD